EPDVLLAGELRAHAAAVAPARAAAQVAAVDDEDVGRAEMAGEVVGDRQAHDAGADDDDVGLRGQALEPGCAGSGPHGSAGDGRWRAGWRADGRGRARWRTARWRRARGGAHDQRSPMTSRAAAIAAAWSGPFVAVIPRVSGSSARA